MLFLLFLQVKNRSRRLTHLFQSYETYSYLVGSHTKVLVTELSHDGNYYVGHTKAYEQVRRLPYNYSNNHLCHYDNKTNNRKFLISVFI